MIATLILSAALAAPSAQFSSTRDCVRTYRLLIKMLAVNYPETEFLVEPVKKKISACYIPVTIRTCGFQVYKKVLPSRNCA